MIFVVIILIFFFQYIDTSYAVEGWLCFQHDAKHTGRSTYPGPEIKPSIHWEGHIDGYIITQPVVTSDGRGYFCSSKGILLSLTFTGKKKLLNLGAGVNSTCVITPSGRIYVICEDGTICAVSLDKLEIEWKYPTNTSVSWTSLIASPEGVIYFGTNEGKLYAIDETGNYLWDVFLGGAIQSSPALDDTGTIYVSSTNGSLYAVTSDGNIKWDKYLRVSPFCSPAISPHDSKIYIATIDNTLLAITETGEVDTIDIGSSIYSSPAFGHNQEIYIGTADGLCVITQDGSIEFVPTGGIFKCNPVVDVNGMVYVASRDGYVYGILNNKIQWKYKIGILPSPMALGPMKTIYIGDRTGGVYILTSAEKKVISRKKRIKPPKGMPKHLQASIKHMKVILTWKDATRRKIGFIIERKTPEEIYKEIARVGKDTTVFEDTQIIPNTDYSYRVCAYNEGGISKYSNEVSITTPQIPPDAPAELYATATSGTCIKLCWKDMSMNETGFVIERCVDTGTYTQLVTVTENITEYYDETVLPRQRYSYRIRAYNEVGFSEYSNEVSILTPDIPPYAPDKLMLTRFNKKEVVITWCDNSDNEAGFIVEKGISQDTFTPVATLTTNSTVYSDTNIKLRKKYYYRVYAYNDIGRSDYCNTLVVDTTPRIPIPPGKLKAEAISAKAVLLNWSDNSDNETGFKIIKKRKGTKKYRLLCKLAPNTTSYEDTKVQPERTYLYRIVSFNDFGQPRYTPAVSITLPPLPPAAPRHVAVELLAPTKVKIRWQDMSRNEKGFKIQRKRLEDDMFVTIATLRANKKLYYDTDLMPNTTYVYRILAYNKGGEGVSDTVSITTSQAIPEPPGRLKVLDISSIAVSLTWDDNSVDEAGFQIERRKPHTKYRKLANIPANTTQYRDFGVLPNTVYFYRICAYNLAGYSKYSNEVKVKTKDIPPFFPSELSAQLKDTKVILCWEDNSVNEIGFKVERKEAGTPRFVEIANVDKNTTYYEDEDIELKKTYYYRVYAYNDIGNSHYSNQVEITIPGPPVTPAGLKGNSTAPDQVNLSWEDTSDDEEGFIIERKINDEFREIGRTSKDNTTFTEINLSPDTSYTYRVCAYNKFGTSGYTNEVIITTLKPPLQAPDNLTGSIPQEGCVYLTWRDNSDDETGFIIERASPDETEFQPIATVAQNTTSYIDIRLLPDKTYMYRVLAFRQDEYSGYSNSISVTTPNVIPEAPDNLVLVTASRDKIVIAWQDNSMNETGFYIERAPAKSMEYNIIGEVPADVTCFEDKNILSGARYQYRVAAYNDVGVSSPSNVLTAVALGPDEINLLHKFIQQPLDEEGFAPTLAWSFQTSQGIRNSSCVLLPHEQRLFFGSTDGKLYCLNAVTGDCIWSYATLKPIVSSPILGEDNTIYVGSRDGYLYAITPEGGLKWRYYVGDSIESSPTVHHGVIYVISKSGDVYAFYPTGEPKWRIKLKGKGFSSPVVGFDGSIYIGVNGDEEYSAIYALTEWGKIKWKRHISYGIRASAGLGYDGSIYVGVKDKNGDNLYAFSEDGVLKWKYATSGWINHSIVVGPDGGIYVPSNEPSGASKLYKINKDGTAEWNFQTGWIYSAPVVDSTGMVYICGNSTIYALDSNGELHWAYTAPSCISSSPVVGHNKMVYFGCIDGRIYALKMSNMPPVAPSELRLNVLSSTSIELTWRDNSNDETGFIIEKRVAGINKFNIVATVGVNTTTFVDSELLPETNYEYRVAAYNYIGESEYSNTCARETFPRPPEEIKNVKVIDLGTGDSLRIEWELPESNNFSHIHVYRSIIPDEIGSLVMDDITESYVIDTNLVTNLTYYYTIRVVDKYGIEVPSDIQYTGKPTSYKLQQ
jgi:titin